MGVHFKAAILTVKSPARLSNWVFLQAGDLTASL